MANKRQIDYFLVSELSRWGRSTSDLRITIEELAKGGVPLRALNGPKLDVSTAQGLMLNLLASISEFERDLLRKGIMSGMAQARSKGTKSGRPVGRPPFYRGERVKRMRSSGRSVRDVATAMGVSKTTVMKVKAAAR
ncbi:MAG: recombinase family protein [Cyanobacteria bacterium SZAS LIN-3]|nr:recombinase family protein [Cyanobacteria bacterium SZAS LIN-3]